MLLVRRGAPHRANAVSAKPQSALAETARRAARRNDLVDDGVCVLFIANKLGVAQPTATSHLLALARAGLVTSTLVGQWTFYQRDEAALAAFKQKIAEEL